MAPTPLAYTFCQQSDVEQILSINGVSLRLDDDNNGAISAAEQNRMTDCINAATETCRYYLYSKYTDAILATSNFVNRACAWLAAYELCATRGNPAPDSIIDEAERWEEKLKAICDNGKRVPGLPYRMSQAIRYDNTRLNPRYNFRVIRVERNTSSPVSTTQPVQTDFQDSFCPENWMI